MRARIALALHVAALIPAIASAQSLPGTADDAAETLMIVPSVVNVPLGGFVVRGGTPDDTVILVDGFEVPRLQHFLGARTVMPLPMIGDGALKTAPDVSIGRASTAVGLTTTTRDRLELDANTFDVGAMRGTGNVAAAMRKSVLGPATNTGYFDAHLAAKYSLSSRWQLFGTWIRSDDDSERNDIAASARFQRLTSGVSYRGGKWRASIAVSTLMASDERARDAGEHYNATRDTIDTRAEIIRTAKRAGGLTDVEWRLGEQTNVAHHDLDVAWPTLPREGSPQPEHLATDEQRFTGTFWTPDAALWTSLAANLARNIRATTGLRVDMFGRGSDIATQPRAELQIGATPRTRIGFAAGAYRRAPQQRDELFTAELNPERTTQVMTRVEHEHQALTVQGNAYYIDRRRLVIRDGFGVLRNTGVGTAYGIELSAQLKLRRWFVWVTGALSRSLRRDFLRAAERPTQFDQPVRVNAIVSWRGGPWRLGGRVQLASGLPETPIVETTYQADRDVYAPVFSFETYSERLPFRYEIDLRADRRIRVTDRVRLDAFVDLQLSTSTLHYHYSFDYKQRVPVTLPIVPFAGLRGTL